MSYSPWGRKELDTTDRLTISLSKVDSKPRLDAEQQLLEKLLNGKCHDESRLLGKKAWQHLQSKLAGERLKAKTLTKRLWP